MLSTVPSVWDIYETAETKDIVLTAVFGTRDYITGSASSGGDYNVPCVSLHLEM